MMSYNFLDPCFRRDGVWILTFVRMTEWEDKN
jgi:hypothetical protein